MGDTLISNREWAAVIWILIFASGVLSAKSLRHSVVGFVKAAIHPKILSVFIGLAGYVALLVIGYGAVATVSAPAAKVFFVWTLTVALPITFRFPDASDPSFFWKAVLDSITLTALLEFVVGLHSFSLGIEILLVPFVTLLVATQTVASMKPEHRTVEPILTFTLAAIGMTLIFFTGRAIVQNPLAVATANTLRELWLPLVLTAAFLPYVYVVALIATYESVFTRLRYFTNDAAIRRFTIRRLLIRFNVRLWSLAAWSKTAEALRFTSREEAAAAVSRPLR